MSKYCADLLIAIILAYQILTVILMGWSTDIREGFVEIMLMNGLITLSLYLYWISGGVSPMCIIVFCIIIFNIGIQFVDDPRDIYPHSLHNIFRRA